MTDQGEFTQQEISDKDIEIVHNLGDIPSFYIDGAQGFAVISGAIKIHLYQLIQHFTGVERESVVKKVFIAQLVMPPTVLPNLARWLTERAKDLEEKEAQEPATGAEPSDGEQ